MTEALRRLLWQRTLGAARISDEAAWRGWSMVAGSEGEGERAVVGSAA